MTNFVFLEARQPFPRWFGPYSPSRGTYAGFRFHGGRLGAWVEKPHTRVFWPLADSSGGRALARLVLDQWGGGRVLMLPNGLTIKPLQEDQEMGRRVLIGRFRGSVVLEPPDGSHFDLGSAGTVLAPGVRWPGPKTIGLECVIEADGSLRCRWYHPTSWGWTESSAKMRGSDTRLSAGFRTARPGDRVGRVRVTAQGIVITNRQGSTGKWSTHFVGRIPPESWPHRREWIREDCS